MASVRIVAWPIGATLLLCWHLSALSRAEDGDPAAWRATATLAAAEAHQAAAADKRFVYAIASRTIGRYDRQTGRPVAISSGAATHLNSGFLWRGRLYCAHSNYPERPERSEILVLDPESMELATYHHFAEQEGSLTWAVRHEESWWCNFAFYDRENARSYLARFDGQWREQARWSYPAELVEKLGRYSLSGGVWYEGQLLATDHDSPVLYHLAVPDEGDVLELVEVLKAPFAGQGIAVDPLTGGLVGVIRKEKVVVFAQRERAAGPRALPPSR